MNFNHAKYSVVAGLSLAVALVGAPVFAEENATSAAEGDGAASSVAVQEAQPEQESTASSAATAQASEVATEAETLSVSSNAVASATIESKATIKQEAVAPQHEGREEAAAQETPSEQLAASEVSETEEGASASNASSETDESSASETKTDETAEKDSDSKDSDSGKDADAPSKDDNKPAEKGWQGSDKEGWKYELSDGTYAKGWQKIDGSTYYFDPSTNLRASGERHLENTEGTGLRWYYFDRSKNDAMTVGEIHRDDDDAHTGWYLYDDTGAMTYGWKWLGNESKWVYYDPYNGIMWHGEGYVSMDNATTADDIPGWCYFDDITGATQYKWKHIDNGDKWVYYDDITGRMYHGEAYVYSGNDAEAEAKGKHWYYFDDYTGATTYGWKNMSDGRTVYYIPTWGWMAHGYYNVTDVDTYPVSADTPRMRSVEESHDRSVTYYFDEYTGNWTVGSAAAWNAYNRIRTVGSPTNYIICVDVTNFRTVIFQGAAFNWKPIFDWNSGVGNPRDPRNHAGGTYTGHYSLGDKNMLAHARHFDDGNHFWFVGMWEGFGFHSTLDGEGSDEDQLGREISLACVRLHYGNAKWLYKHCPDGTPVYIYR